MDTDKLLEQFESYSKILKKYFPEEGIDTFLEEFGTRLVTCPRGLTSEEGGEYGELVTFQMKMAVCANDFSSLAHVNCDSKSAVRVALVHELGKLGDEANELFISQESQWHRDKLGQNFKYNERCQKMSVAHRTLYLLQKYKIEITQEEWIAIITSQGMQYPENAFYAKTGSKLPAVINFSKSVVSH